MNYNVALKDGRVVSGIIADESANAISLKRAEGATDVIARDQIETIASTGDLSDARGARDRAFDPRHGRPDRVRAIDWGSIDGGASFGEMTV